MKKLVLAFFLFSTSFAYSADLPIIFTKSYEVKDADEALAMFHHSRVLAEVYFKTDNLKFKENPIMILPNRKFLAVYHWRKR